MAARAKKTSVKPTSSSTANIVTPEEDDFAPVRITTNKAKAQDDPGVPLFYLDDTEYRIPTRVSRSVLLEFLRLSRTLGDMVAGQRLLERLLGPDAYMALEESDEIDDEHIERIVRTAIHHVAGPSESGK